MTALEKEGLVNTRELLIDGYKTEAGQQAVPLCAFLASQYKILIEAVDEDEHGDRGLVAIQVPPCV